MHQHWSCGIKKKQFLSVTEWKPLKSISRTRRLTVFTSCFIINTDKLNFYDALTHTNDFTTLDSTTSCSQSAVSTNNWEAIRKVAQEIWFRISEASSNSDSRQPRVTSAKRALKGCKGQTRRTASRRSSYSYRWDLRLCAGERIESLQIFLSMRD